jgi:hypothetical protein
VDFKAGFSNYVTDMKNISVVRNGLHNVTSFMCSLCFLVAMLLSSQKLTGALSYKLAVIIYLLPAKESFFYYALESLAVVWRKFVAMMEHVRCDRKPAFRIPNHHIAIATNRKLPLDVVQTNEPRWRSA